MANYKLNHSRSLSKLNNDYWTNPSKGFDQTWHKSKKQSNTKAKQFAESIAQGKHGSHKLDVVLTEGTHAGKIVCNTCNKFVAWIPKQIINT